MLCASSCYLTLQKFLLSTKSASSAVSLISNMILKSPDKYSFSIWWTGQYVRSILTSILLQILHISGNQRLCARHRIGSDPILLWMLFLTAPTLHLFWVPPAFQGEITQSCWRQYLGVIQWLSDWRTAVRGRLLTAHCEMVLQPCPDKPWYPRALPLPLRALMQLQLQGRGAVDCWGMLQRNTKSPRSRTNLKFLPLEEGLGHVGVVLHESQFWAAFSKVKSWIAVINYCFAFQCWTYWKALAGCSPACCQGGWEVVGIPWLFWKAGLFWEEHWWLVTLLR